MDEKLTAATEDYLLRHTREGMWRIPKDEILPCCSKKVTSAVPMSHQRSLEHVAEMYKVRAVDLARQLLYEGNACNRFLVARAKSRYRFEDPGNPAVGFELDEPSLSLETPERHGGFKTLPNANAAAKEHLAYGQEEMGAAANPAHSRSGSTEGGGNAGLVVLEVIACGTFKEAPHDGFERRYYEEVLPSKVAMPVSGEDVSRILTL